MDYFKQAENWLAQDPDEETRAELQQLINDKNEAELKKRFSSRLQFGTAGLRGRLQAGSNGMNRVVVAQTAVGLANYLKKNFANPSIVIGYDGRKNSDIFAKDTAGIMAEAGIKTLLLPEALPTPVLAFALRKLDYTAGVMVTASHNPPEDNGYKVYLGDWNGGGQIISPTDSEIAREIDLVAEQDIRDLNRSENYRIAEKALWADYVATTASILETKQTMPKKKKVPASPLFNQNLIYLLSIDYELNYVYTAMHGVGCETFLAVLKEVGFPLPHLVAKQCTPDGSFPTVRFPNPEEKGALDLAIETAKKNNAELIIANDPDADRLAVAVRLDNGEYQILHGNTVGVYLADYLVSKSPKSASNVLANSASDLQSSACSQKPVLANSLVSTPLLGKIAEKNGFEYQTTLTGFKYIGKVKHLFFGFEEALGYLVDPKKVRDKDGISAGLMFLAFWLDLKAKGQSFQDYQRAFVEKYGASASGQIAIRVEDLSEIGRLMRAFRDNPPSAIGLPVKALHDYAQDAVPNEILSYDLDGGGRVIIRPSGTEPKIKFYLDALADSQNKAEALLKQIEQGLKNILEKQGVQV